MFFDPIVDEIHEIRQLIWKEAGSTWEGLLKYLREKRPEYIDRLITPERTEEGDDFNQHLLYSAIPPPSGGEQNQVIDS